MTARRRLLPPVLAFVLSVAAGGVGAFAVFGILLSPPAAPKIALVEPALPALTKHLLLVVIDGLRYDVGTDPGRMPEFALAMHEHTSGEVWAGRVSMTSSAVLAYATGQWGALEQAVLNLAQKPPSYDSWLENARARGLSLGASGEHAWQEMFGAHFTSLRMGPGGVRFDYAPALRAARELLREEPNFLVVQFTTPDQQGHAHGIPSAEYAAHVRTLDRDLHQLLTELGPDWTVVVTSDHGAADSGTHGADVPIQRRTPIYAYGPGIAPGVKLGRRIEQIELASTFSALLGVPPPAHSRGHALVEWLALEPSQRARVACLEARRALGYARAVGASVAIPPELLGGCQETEPRPELIADTRKLVQGVDRAITTSSGRDHPALPALVAIVGLLSLGVSLIIFGRAWLKLLPGAVLLAVLAVGLVYQVERFPGNVPNLVRIVLFTLANLIALFALVVPPRLAAWLDRHPLLGPLIVPGMLIAAYPADAQPESYVALAVGAFALALSPSLEAKPIDVLRGRGPGFFRALALLPLCLMLLPAGTRDENVYGSWALRHPTLLMLAALASVTVWSVVRAASLSARSEWRAVAVGLPIVLGSLLLSRVAPPFVGRSLPVVLLLLALVLMRQRQPSLALHFGLASYAWLSRDFELLALVATLGVVDVVGTSLASLRGVPRPSLLMLLSTLVFGVLYVQRIGLQGGIDFGNVDVRAGAFGDPMTPLSIVIGATIWKHALAALLTLGVLVAHLGRRLSDSLLAALSAIFAVRFFVLLLMLLVAGGSFWTAMRVMGDLPFALLFGVLTTLSWTVMRARELFRPRTDELVHGG